MEAKVHKILFDFGSLQLNPMFIAMIIVSLLLLAIGQSYVSAKKLKVGPAMLVMGSILIIGLFILYFIWQAFFAEKYPPDYTFPHVSIYTYGFMLMLAFVIGAFWLIREGRIRKPLIEADTILDIFVFIIIGSIIGARFIYILTQWSDYFGPDIPVTESIRRVIQITEGGLSIHGGIFGALIFGAIYIKAKGMEFWDTVDFFMPALALGIAIGRIGCFLNGCCYGIACEPNFPMGVKFPNAATWESRGYPTDLAQLYDAGQAALGTAARHPAQLYEAAGAFALFIYLMNFRHNRVFKGHVFLMFVIGYSALRFWVEMFRFGDPADAKGSAIILWNSITVAQLASVVLFTLALILTQDLKRRATLARMFKGEEAEEVEEEEDEEEELEVEDDTDEEMKTDLVSDDEVKPEHGTDNLQDLNPEKEEDNPTGL